MGNIRHVKYAARDANAGAAQYNEHSDYVKSKNITTEGPHEQLEAVQIALATYYELQNTRPNHENIITKMEPACPQSVNAGRKLFHKGELQRLVSSNGALAEAFDVICRQLNA